MDSAWFAELLIQCPPFLTFLVAAGLVMWSSQADVRAGQRAQLLSSKPLPLFRSPHGISIEGPLLKHGLTLQVRNKALGLRLDV